MTILEITSPNKTVADREEGKVWWKHVGLDNNDIMKLLEKQISSLPYLHN